jgi:DNA-binding transcriptional ArsR family regulator
MKMTEALDALGALAHETRLDVFRALVRSGPEGCAAGAIAGRLGLPAPTLSFHLARLARAGLVQGRRQGRSLVYSADYAAVRGLVAYLTENCCAERTSARTCRPARARVSSR